MIWNFVQFLFDRVQHEHCSSSHCQGTLIWKNYFCRPLAFVKIWVLELIKKFIVIIITIHNIFFKVTTVIRNTYMSAFSPSILQSSFCGILLEEGLEKISLRQSSIRHPTRSAYCAVPILGFQKPKNCIGQCWAVCGGMRELRFFPFPKIFWQWKWISRKFWEHQSDWVNFIKNCERI